jgi:mono/diheme cytochrome c family protein
MDISQADVVKLAHVSLLQRLHDGGQSMPAFPHLTEAEIRSLVAYLKQLAGVPGAASEQIAVQESPVRIGEHIVKSTCHTCHSATGADPEPHQIWDGAIPPLSALPTRKSQPEFIRKVTYGAPILMGTPPMLYRGRIPVFYYLSEQEAADVYLYLTTYPPSEPEGKSTSIALSKQNATLRRSTRPL